MSSLFNINVCRVCIKNEQSFDLRGDKVLLEKFEFTTRLQVSKEDNLPKTICSKCVARLKLAYHFIKTAHESENNLKIFLEKISSDFKEVTRNKSCKKFSSEQSFTDDDFLYLMEEENHEEFLTCLEDGNDKITKNSKSGIKNFNDDKQNSKKDRNNSKNESGYSISADILLVDASDEIDSAYENDSHLMEIPKQECFTKPVEEDQELDNQTYTNVNILESNEESDICDQSPELPIEEPDENHQYDVIINSPEDKIQCQTVYIDEISIEGTNRIDKDDDNFSANNLNEHENAHKEDEINEHREMTINTFYKRGRIPRFYCEKCNRDFSNKPNLNRHMQSHEGNKPFSCTECKKSFTQKSTLKQHMYTHTGERPYVCEICNRGFTQCKSLTFHMRRHTGEKPFHCEYCLINFRQKDALRIHILKHHVVIEQSMDGTEIFSCIICQRKFETKDAFKTHMKVHTATGDMDNIVEVFRDEKEKLTTKITTNVNRAKKFQCSKCFKSFALHKSLVRHVRIHYPKSDDLSECFDFE